MSDTIVAKTALQFDSRGLVPAVAQDARNGRLLMLAWMNAEALEATQATGYAHYFSRSRQSLWLKGETSGHRQRVLELRTDCDADAVLMLVEQEGPACHTGRPSCFYKALEGEAFVDASPPPATAVERLAAVLHARRHDSPDASYTARLLHRGMGKITEKVDEEAGELVEALLSEADDRVVSEAADLLYHTLVGFEARGIDPLAVAAELARRFGTSGLEEKASRQGGQP